MPEKRSEENGLCDSFTLLILILSVGFSELGFSEARVSPGTTVGRGGESGKRESPDSYADTLFIKRNGVSTTEPSKRSTAKASVPWSRRFRFLSMRTSPESTEN